VVGEVRAGSPKQWSMTAPAENRFSVQCPVFAQFLHPSARSGRRATLRGFGTARAFVKGDKLLSSDSLPLIGRGPVVTCL